MNQINDANGVDTHLKELIRYVKDDHIMNGKLTDAAFQLRENRKPPEKYLSFFHSSAKDCDHKVEQVRMELKARGFSPNRKKGGFLFLNAMEASNEINVTRKIVEFKLRKYPKYGMSYISDDKVDVLEAKTLLIHHSSLVTGQNNFQNTNHLT